ncbi:hypothetical protein HGRIS_001159 [Hohenbuehelia grisea]|uniref:Uncharacterized protein n=1 Tax=Hohenbuehelia grisea TaxID=104357 RepID=A0ABR3JQC5_9AGAR
MPRIRKVGVKFGGDMTRLFNDCGFVIRKEEGFTGVLELGAMAKERNAAMHASIGLADLVAVLLRKFLHKESAVRVNPDWDAETLSDWQ